MRDHQENERREQHEVHEFWIAVAMTPVLAAATAGIAAAVGVATTAIGSWTKTGSAIAWIAAVILALPWIAANLAIVACFIYVPWVAFLKAVDLNDNNQHLRIMAQVIGLIEGVVVQVALFVVVAKIGF